MKERIDLTPYRRRPEMSGEKRQHLGPLVKLALVFTIAVIAIQVFSEVWPPVRRRLELRSLAAQLTGRDESAREDAASALALRGSEGLPYLLSALRDSRADVREAALSALVKACPDPKVVLSAVTTALGDSDAGVRGVAVESLGQVVTMQTGRDAAESPQLFETVLDDLKKALKDPDGGIRGKAADTLAKFGRRAQSATADLTAVLSNPDASIRMAAALALLQVDSGDNAEALRTLTESFSAPEALDENWAAFESLVKLKSPAAAAAVPGLIAKVNTADPVEQSHAFEALRQIGPPAHKALPALQNYLARHGPRMPTQQIIAPSPRWRQPPVIVSLRYLAASAAARIEDGTTMSPWIASALKDIATSSSIDLETRKGAARDLKAADPKALSALVPILIDEIIQEKDPSIRKMKSELLLEIDPVAVKQMLKSDPLPEN